MHLKSLTMKGFKSFASATTLRFEPGITAVVGPNGSGKSNVVDAIAWVLGEQGAKALRGGKMEDVIFAGTADRPPLGRAEVTLTIDNSDGALPIDYAEVSITRRMFRDGVGEYEINGSSCRLLDIQELLSDSGIGREMHVIVGQGQLDAVLQARPEDRRAFVEEAAGVLKHRKRREKTVRKLDAMQANLNRLTDLTGEIRRQLGPLGRQAAIARRAAGCAGRPAGRQNAFAGRRSRADHGQDRAGGGRRAGRDRSPQAGAGGARRRLRRAADRRGDAAGRDARAAAGAGHLVRVVRAGRTDARHHRAGRRTGQEPRRAGPGRRPPAGTPTSWRRPPPAPRPSRKRCRRPSRPPPTSWPTRPPNGSTASGPCGPPRANWSPANRLIADRREGLARLAGQVAAAKSRLSAGDDEVTRLAQAVTEARERAAAAESAFATAQDSVGDLDSSEIGLDEAHEEAAAAAAAATARTAELTDALRTAQTTASTLRARVEALSLGLDRRDGTQALLTAGEALPGLLGGVADALEITPGYETAIAAALGAIAEAVAVGTVPEAAAALELLRANGSGRAGVLVQGPRNMPDRRGWPDLPDGARWAIDLLTARSGLLPALARALDRVVVVRGHGVRGRVSSNHPGRPGGHRGRRPDRPRLGGRRQRRWPVDAGDPGHQGSGRRRTRRDRRDRSPVSRPRWPAPRPRPSSGNRTRPEPLPRCIIPTPGCPRSPRNWPASARPRGPPPRRPTGSIGSGKPPSSPATSTAPRCRTCRTGCSPSSPRTRRRRSTPPPATRWPN